MFTNSIKKINQENRATDVLLNFDKKNTALQ
jgi:hypothetical protein